jgi:hypothetical protein
MPDDTTYYSRITHRCEEEEVPGFERVTVNLHAPPESAGYQIKEFEVLPTLLHALAYCSVDPRYSQEEQGLLEICRRQICKAFLAGSELPPMQFVQDRIDKHNAILRCHLFLPKLVTERCKAADACREGITVANEVARSGW